VDTGALVNTLTGHQAGIVYALDLLKNSNGSNVLMSGSLDKTIKIWNNSLLIATFTDHFNFVYSLRYFSNRTNVNYHHTCSEKITLKSIKPLPFDELISIKGFLVCNINTALMCIDSKGYIEVIDVEIIIM
jgi:WD40 repeat protein